MIYLTRTDSENQEFRNLVGELDADLSIRDGGEHAFYSQYNTIQKIKNVVIAHDGEIPVGCGAIKEFDPATMEVKRMYVLPGYRGQGIASLILKELEKWAAELNYQKCILETGKRQPEAISLYQKNGYKFIPNYGQYEQVANSVCMERILF